MHQPSYLPSEAVVAATVTPALHAADDPRPLWELVNDLQDGAVLSDEDGTIVLATPRVAQMFGYRAAELASRPIESLIPTALLATRYRHRVGGIRPLRSWPVESGERLTGVHRDGTVFPVELSRSQVTIGGGRLTLTTIREVAQGLRLGTLLSRAAPWGERA
jgi:PAS domain S-box-containing protein